MRHDEALRMLVEHHLQDNDVLGVAARQLHAAWQTKRPASWDRAMEILGEPESNDVETYVASLEQALGEAAGAIESCVPFMDDLFLEKYDVEGALERARGLLPSAAE